MLSAPSTKEKTSSAELRSYFVGVAFYDFRKSLCVNHFWKQLVTGDRFTEFCKSVVAYEFLMTMATPRKEEPQ